MIRHLLKLVWHRKRANALLIVEILFSFVVLFSVLTLAASTVMRWKKPLGFDYHDIWCATVSFPPEPEMLQKDEPAEREALRAMMKEARALPQVESIAGAGMPPYSPMTWISGLTVNGREVDVTKDGATDDFATTMRLRVLRGRWFDAGDDGARIMPIVVDADAAHALYGTIDCVGKVPLAGPDEQFRIVGVVAPYRKNGELSQDKVKMVFERVSLAAAQGHVPRVLMIRVRPGTPADFEEMLIKRLHAAAPAYTVRVQHLEQQRMLMNRLWLAPAVAGAIIAAFLMIMVALGLSGVLWQTVTQRRRELGLRRALGATGTEVNRQILAEVGLLTTLALVAGIAIVAQFPLLGRQTFFTPSAFALGLGAALVTIYGLTLLCALYPSWLAGKVQPAEALHYE